MTPLPRKFPVGALGDPGKGHKSSADWNEPDKVGYGMEVCWGGMGCMGSMDAWGRGFWSGLIAMLHWLPPLLILSSYILLCTIVEVASDTAQRVLWCAFIYFVASSSFVSFHLAWSSLIHPRSLVQPCFCFGIISKEQTSSELLFVLISLAEQSRLDTSDELAN